MSHAHHHHGPGCQHHAPPDSARAFAIGIALNAAFIVVEVIWGIKANSLALLADAWHNASDVLALVMGWVAVMLSRRKPSGRYTYGWRSSSIVASLASAILLLVVTGGIGWESLQRLARPEASGGGTVMIVAALGVLINGGTALLFVRGRHEDLNVRGAYLHMLADAAISVGVVLSGFLMLHTGWLWLDPAASLVIALLIILSGWDLLKESLSLILQAVPKNIDAAQVKAWLGALPGVREVHDLHIWAMSTTEVASSVHLVMAGGHPGDAFIKDVAHRLAHDFRITHTTIQIEVGDTDTECPLAPDHIV